MTARTTTARITTPRPAAVRLAAVAGGLLGVAALAGCAPAASTSGDGAAASDAPSAAAPASSAPAASGADDSGLKDGSYTATGDYTSPGGPSAVEVTVALKSGDIASVEVVPKAENPTARQYESQFASGVGAVAVGKPIEGLKVGTVSGSSLTSAGFEKALAAIRSKAAA